jgi:hypothetical protein
MSCRHLRQLGVRNEPKRARRKADQIMVHDPEVKALKVRYVARNMQGQDLSLSVGGRFRPRGKPLNNQAALAGTIAIGDDDFTGAEMPFANPQP